MSREMSSHGSIERELSGDSALGSKTPPSALTSAPMRRGGGPFQSEQKSPLASAVRSLSLSSAGESDDAVPSLERGSSSPKSPGASSLTSPKRGSTSPSSSTLLPPLPLQRTSTLDGISPKAGGVLKWEGRSPASPYDGIPNTGRTPTARSNIKR